MELFPASDDAQWELIKRVIEESDYYIVIVGGRYGSVGPTGISYTEMEYDYAAKIGVPILGFIRQDVENIPQKKLDLSQDARSKLESFRKKVMMKTCRQFSDPKDLGMAVMKSLMQEARIRPRIGWIRADQARSKEDVEREINLEKEISAANKKIRKLERELRDRAVLGREVERESLASGNDIFYFDIIYSASDKTAVSETVGLTWNDIIIAIGPDLYGFIQRRPGSGSQYYFEDAIEHKIRTKIINKVGMRKLSISPTCVDLCVFHLKELGLVRFVEKEEDGDVFRGVTLTELGEIEMSRLMISKKSEKVQI